MSSLMKVGSLDDIRIGTGAYLGLHASDLVNLSWSDVWNRDAGNSHNVFSFVFTNKKTNQSDVTPSDWLSNVGPAELEPRLAVKKMSGGHF